MGSGHNHAGTAARPAPKPPPRTTCPVLTGSLLVHTGSDLEFWAQTWTRPQGSAPREWFPAADRRTESPMVPVAALAAHSIPFAKSLGFVIQVVIVVVAATSIAACSADSGDGEGGQASKGPQTPSATVLGGQEVIAFERLRPGTEERDLYVVGADGGEPELLRSPGDYPHWSPDGSQLAFLACLNPPDCTTAVALMDRSTGDVHGFPMPDPNLETPCAVW